MESLLNALRELDALRDNVEAGQRDSVWLRTTEAIPPIYSRNELNDEKLKQALQKLGIDSLYEHQYRAINSISSGKDTVLVSPTASGKTLCFNLPIVTSLSHDQQGKALMVYPTKALAYDQRGQLQSFSAAYGATSVESWMYDGDVAQQDRDILRKNPPSILLTNPEYLHLSFCAHHQQWLPFLKELRYLVLDEIHEYRGFFGTNVALLIRRFLYLLAGIGVKPTIILSSATCSNPEEHASRLTGIHPEVIIDRSGMRPRRHFVFIDPNIPDFRFPQIFPLRIARTALSCLKKGLATIVFCPTRKMVEECFRLARDDAEKFGLNSSHIVPYRSGYTPTERRDIEDGLQTGRYRVVFSTNALEIGINIGKLDVCVMAGFPDNIMSAWQRIGRAGRSWNKDAHVIYFAMNNPVDRFYAENIDAFINRPLDEIFIGYDNEELIQRHLPCLWHENGPPHDNAKAESLLGKKFYLAYSEIAKRHKKATIKGNATPHQKCSIRSVGGKIWRLACRGKEIGTVSDQQVFRECYIGAIYKHIGKSYRVVAHGVDEVLLEDAPPGLRTEGAFWSNAQIDSIRSGFRWDGELATHYGVLTIYENFGGYKLVDADGSVIDTQMQTGAQRKRVHAFWMSIESKSSTFSKNGDRGFRGIEQLLRIGAPFVIPCDRFDLGSLCDTKIPITVYLHENVPGGIGLAEKLLSVWHTVLEQGMKIAANCECKSGCPRCIHANKFDRDVTELKKDEVLKFAEKFIKHTSKPAEEVFSSDFQAWSDAVTVS